MARISIENLVTSTTPVYLTDTAYDYTKWNLSKGVNKVDGGTAATRYVSAQFDAIRVLEESWGVGVGPIFALNFSASEDYLWTVEGTAGNVVAKKIGMWIINKKTGARSWKGWLTMNIAGASEAKVIRDFKIDQVQYSTGTAANTGTAVTLAGGAAVQTARMAVGARIGFGSTDPTAITTWYKISAIGSETSITLATTPATNASAGPYIIEEYRPVVIITATTAANGGVFLAKGVTPEDYTVAGSVTLAAANSEADSLKRVYWLKDAAVVTNTVAGGSVADFAGQTQTNLDFYVLNITSSTTAKFYKYNIRAALGTTAATTGAVTTAYVLTTGDQTGLVATIGATSNLAIATANHGLGSGVKSVYFVSSGRFYRAAVANLTSGNVNWLSDSVTEIPTGGVTAYLATATMSGIEYVGDMDMFLISTLGNYNYLTKYNAGGVEYDKIWGNTTAGYEGSAKSALAPIQINIGVTGVGPGVVFTFSDTSGTNMVYMAKQSIAAGMSLIYVTAFGADWISQQPATLISPQIATPNCQHYYRAFANHINYLGGDVLGRMAEPFKLYARTTNITSDTTTGWSLLDETNDLSGLGAASSIQFKIEFKTIGQGCIPARILGCNFSYEDNTTISNYAASVGKSSLSTKRFAFWFKTAFGTAVPNLRITLYDADTGGQLLTDTSAAPASGTWDRMTDGTNWIGSYATTDRANATTFISYTPTSLADNIKVAAYLTLA